MLRILECTLRDGSYALDFQFTARDTASIAAALEQVGFDLIEVGHGVGLNAARKGYGDAAETDEGYMLAAADVLSTAKFGVFCIPGIAEVGHVDMAADCGAGFIRIGTNITEVERSRPFIERARERGLYVCANFMKSYAVPPEVFAQNAAKSADYGAETLYIVDSAGGMLPSELGAYFRALRARTDRDIAFHGHNNLGLAVANSAHLAELGATIADGSLQGLGRSSGNAPTEQLLCVLQRMGIGQEIDAIDVMDVGERFVRPLIESKGYASLDTTSGLAQFHSSYMGVIREISTRYDVDPRRLIIEVCKTDKANAPKELVEAVAQRLKHRGPAVTAQYGFQRYRGSEQSPASTHDESS